MALSRRSHVALMFMGGSVIDVRGRRGDQVVRPSDIEPWMKAMSEMDILADTEGFFIASGQPAIGVAAWSELGRRIKAIYSRFDGFVVIHEIDSIPAAAMSASLMVQNLEKPVVFVGSSLRSKRSTRSSTLSQIFGPKASIINAVQVAISDVAEVVVVYGSTIFKGSTTGIDTARRQVLGQEVGKIDFGIRLTDQLAKRGVRKPKFRTTFETSVSVGEYFPGLDLAHLVSSAKKARGLFLTTAEPLGQSEILKDLVHQLGSRYPIGVYAHVGTVDRWPNSIVPLVAPSRSSALVQFRWGLAQTRLPGALKKLLKPV